MLFLFTILAVLAAAGVIAYFSQRRSRQRLSESNTYLNFERENLRPLFQATDEDLRLAAADEEAKKHAIVLEETRLDHEKKLAKLDELRQTWLESSDKPNTIELLYRASQSERGEVYSTIALSVIENWRAGKIADIEVRVVFRVKPEDAPFMIARIGNTDRLIQNVMHPLIDSIFRNQSESSAMAYLQNRHEEQERAEARVRMHLLKYHVDAVNVLICHIHLPEELMKTQTEKILAEQRQNMYFEQEEAESKRIELEKTRAHADNQKSLMEATVGVEIAAKRSEQRQREADGEAYYISSTGKAEAEKMRSIGEAQGVAYNEQVKALGGNNIAIIETLKVIGEKGVRITPDILASGGGNGDGGGIGNLLLLNLFRDQLNNSVEPPTKAPVNGNN